MATTSKKPQQVIVGMAIPGDGIVSVGVLLVERNITPNVDRSVGRFRYAPSYLKRPNATPLDPVQMPLSDGEFRFARFGGMPGAMRDSSTDNWGRTLIRRYFQSKGSTQPISEVDYLLCSPADRAGNLHFATGFTAQGSPNWDAQALTPEALPEIQELQSYVLEVLRNPNLAAGTSYPKKIDSLLTGAGGGRPKATIKTPSGLYILKMANPITDTTPNARLEAASLEMAKRCSIVTATTSVQPAGTQDMLAVKRFDQDENGKRHQMVSAMTVLNASDDPYNRTNWSYPQLAHELARWSSQPDKDREQLFRAMVLRAMLSDSDDHPRNYALIRDAGTAGGSSLGQWRLAPMYDCVVGLGTGHKASELAMTIGRFGYTISEENITSDAKAFGLSQDQARQITMEIQATVIKEFPSLLDRHGVAGRAKELAMQSVAPLDDRPMDSAIERMMARMSEVEVNRPPTQING